MKYKITLLFALLIGFISTAQVTNEGKPKSWDWETSVNLNPIILPAFDLKKLQEEDLINDQRKDIPWRFGHEILVDYNLQNSGQWTTLDNGDRVWRIRIASKGAKTMNFFFSDFFMPEGASLYLYNNNRSDLLGAYTSIQNNEENVLGTWLVKGGDIWLEYYEPQIQSNKGKLEIFKVIHGYRSSDDFLKSPDDDLNGSGNCNYDVECDMGIINDLKETNKKSVALIVVNNSGFCSGALINNTSNDGTPYFLTANHCYSNPSSWAFRFHWISPDPVCGQNTASTNTSDILTISGATLRARRQDSDFCLVEINSAIPSNWDVKWAGWDRSTAVSPFTFGIHHPSGDIMKACLDNNPPVSLDDDGNYWRVQDWDMGVTEGGSSGSPFFNNEGRIIGQLWRGSAACNGTVDNGGSDEYGRLNVSWDAGSASSSRLKEWLDPTNTGVTSIDVYPSNELFAVNAKGTITGISSIICGTTITPSLQITNDGTDVLTSALVSYALNMDFPTEINWTGTILPGESTTIDFESMSINPGANTFYTNIEIPNGVADQFFLDNASSFAFNVAQVYETTQLTFNLETDDYGNETSWSILNSTGTTIAEGDDYQSNQTYTQIIELPQDDCYTFTINDEEGDGICCAYGEGSYSLTTNNVIIIEGGDFGGGETKTFQAVENLSNDDIIVANAIKIYPNPSNGWFTLANTKTLDVDYEIYNLLGQQILTGHVGSNAEQAIDLSRNSNGIYLAKITDSNGSTQNIKLIKK